MANYTVSDEDAINYLILLEQFSCERWNNMVDTNELDNALEAVREALINLNVITEG